MKLKGTNLMVMASTKLGTSLVAFANTPFFLYSGAIIVFLTIIISYISDYKHDKLLEEYYGDN